MQVYISVCVNPGVDEAPFVAAAVLLGKEYKLNGPDRNGNRWLNLAGEIHENDLAKLAAIVSQ